MKQNKALVLFLVKAGVLYAVWHLIYQNIFEEEGIAIRRVAEHVAAVSAAMLRGFGYDAVAQRFQGFDTMLVLSGKPVVWIDSGCTGLTLMALFAGFVIAYPGPWKKKAWYIPVGIFVIYIVNLIRVLALALNHGHSSFEFNHKYTYTIFTYAAIFGLWMLWANRLSGMSLTRSEDEEEEEEKVNA